MIYYLTVAIVRPAEPAHDGRPHPGEGPGQGPEKWPIRERLCHGEVREARWEDPTVPGILDGDIHGSEEDVTTMGKHEVWLSLELVPVQFPAAHL